MESKLDIFDRHRPRLFGLAYRMLGTRDDAEDVLQDAYIRWHNADVASIETPEAWLVTTATRLSIDRLRKASTQRETYIGPWLPEPIMISNAPSPHDDAELASGLSIAFIALLERLSPSERAAFLLHDIFDCAYTDIARIIGKNETAARQIVSRARTRVRNDKPRFDVEDTEKHELIRKFALASSIGDEATMISIFAPEMMSVADGGGIVTASRKIIYGGKKIANLYSVQSGRWSDPTEVYLVYVNGEPGMLRLLDGKPYVLNTFEIEEGRITAMYSVMNPSKLKALDNFNKENFVNLSQIA
jgi:RNA polymerase sigma-70 factor (ECF subfamily)